ncbi:hypothetical protein [Paramicrobacterium fandaimingii]|uniref:hypothetical protein n=1 Tax=Paramicrobacterium fandaimingii TaxID=2708079 RepID=UPI0014246F7A|nr:hypothetical protein [Microbacterium fandaimingii]
MRWDSLFDDLEGQLDSAWSAEDIERRAEDERLRIGRLSLRDRMIAYGQSSVDDPSMTRPMKVILRSGRDITVQPRTFGRDWIAADLIRQHGSDGACVIALAGISSILLHPDDVERSIAEGDDARRGPQITDRIGFPFVLRDLCRRRTYVTMSTVMSSDAIGGTLDRVARDHVDIARHARGTPRRARDVAQVQLVALSAIDLVEL